MINEVEKSTIIEMQKPIGITPQQELACYMLAIGLKPKQVAQDVGVTQLTIGNWRKRDDLKFVIKQVQYRLFGKDAKRRFEALTHEAISTLEEIMKDSKIRPSSRISAAKEILDRSIGKPEQKHKHETEGMAELFNALDEIKKSSNAITHKKQDIEDVDYMEIADNTKKELESSDKSIIEDVDL